MKTRLPVLTQRTRVIESIKSPAGEGPRVKIVLVDEGLGNRRNMNFYGPEAIASAPKRFEGKPCFLNHPSESEESDLPERSVRKQCGYYKNLEVAKVKSPESGKMVDACVGELHFDLSEAGAEGYAKALTALHYQREFPGSAQQYIGFSVLGDGRAEKRPMSVDGKTVDVNYVLEFVEGDSCDMVTRAGRGGRILDVMVAESADGTKESDMKALAKFKKTLASLKESHKKATGDEQKRLSVAIEALEANIAEAEAEAAAGTVPPAAPACEEDDTAMFERREGESDDAHRARLDGYSKALAKHLAPAAPAAQEEGEEPAPAAMESGRKPKALTASELERNTIAVKAVMREAGVPEKAYPASKLDRLARMPFDKAKAVIEEDARLAESIADGLDLPVGSLRRGTVRESGDKSMNDVFAGAYAGKGK